MKWTNSKSVPQFPGLIDVEVVDDAVTAIVVAGQSGPIRISKRDYGGLTFFTPTPPKTAPRQKVSGKVDGLEIAPQYFESDWEASRVRDKSPDNLTIAEVTVYVDDDGNMTGEVAKSEGKV